MKALTPVNSVIRKSDVLPAILEQDCFSGGCAYAHSVTTV